MKDLTWLIAVVMFLIGMSFGMKLATILIENKKCKQQPIELTATDSLKIANHYAATHKCIIAPKFYNDTTYYSLLITEDVR